MRVLQFVDDTKSLLRSILVALADMVPELPANERSEEAGRVLGSECLGSLCSGREFQSIRFALTHPADERAG